jgi:hypothetical protein
VHFALLIPALPKAPSVSILLSGSRSLFGIHAKKCAYTWILAKAFGSRAYAGTR